MPRSKIFNLLFPVITIASGNLFWKSFAEVLSGEPLLTNSPFQVIWAFLNPIIWMAIFITAFIYTSQTYKKRSILFPVALASTLAYLIALGFNLPTFLGVLGISLCLMLFAYTYDHLEVSFNHRPTILGHLSLSLASASLMISIIVAVNFYSFYRRALSESNQLFSDRVIARTLSPIVRLYMKDLGVTNLEESFDHYLKRQAGGDISLYNRKQTEVLSDLDLPVQNPQTPMRQLINNSLKNSALRIVAEYRSKIPLIVSLGLGIITQTVLTVSTLIAGLLTFLIDYLIKKSPGFREVMKD